MMMRMMILMMMMTMTMVAMVMVTMMVVAVVAMVALFRSKRVPWSQDRITTRNTRNTKTTDNSLTRVRSAFFVQCYSFRFTWTTRCF